MQNSLSVGSNSNLLNNYSEINAELRERFLKIISSLSEPICSTALYYPKCFKLLLEEQLDHLFEEPIVFQFRSFRIGRQCTINMYEKTTVFAEFQGANSDITELCVKRLSTPSGVFHEHAVLRMNDVIDIEI